MDRIGTRREYLMCPPTYFTVNYSINPWMDVTKPVETSLALAQWERLKKVFTDLGHQVHLVEPVDGLPDMVFAANGATAVGGRAVLARFRYAQRAGEVDAYRRWFTEHGYGEVRQTEAVNEGEGDLLVAGERILAGTGFRTEPAAHREARELLGREVIPLTLCDPRFYHLDTALAVLTDDEIMYYPAAFTPYSQAVLRELYPDAIRATLADASAFGVNAVSDGRNVVLSQTAVGVLAQLRDRGYVPIGVDVSELRKAGGGVKCCALELHR